jgi:FMN reductase
MMPLIVGIGGTLRPQSSGASALRLCLAHAEARGARTLLFTGDALRLPLYDPQASTLDASSVALVEALRAADGVVLASPGYHGGISGTLKNALDYTEEMRGDARGYLDGRAVGCVAAAAGWQAAGATLSALRAIVHALRGWPTPLGVMLNSAEPLFDGAGGCLHDGADAQLRAMTDQVIRFAEWQTIDRAAA